MEKNTINQTVEPVWTPLAKLFATTDHALEHSLLCSFMYMYSARSLMGLTIHAYKHIDTRRYLFVDLAGTVYRFDGDGDYQEVPTEQAVQQVLTTVESERWKKDRDTEKVPV